MAHLVDTCVWIDFLKGHAHPKVSFLEGLLEEGEAYICEIVYAEICYGAKDEHQFKQYARLFGQMPFLALEHLWHEQAAQMGFRLRRAGHVPHSADLLIALTALEHDVALVTTDRDFLPFTDLFCLRLE